MDSLNHKNVRYLSIFSVYIVAHFVRGGYIYYYKIVMKLLYVLRFSLLMLKKIVWYLSIFRSLEVLEGI